MNHIKPMSLSLSLNPSSRKRTRADLSHSDDDGTHTDSDTEHETDTEHEKDLSKKSPPSANFPRFIVMKPTYSEQSLTKLSPFAVEKSILGRYGTVKQVKKLKDGSLLIEVEKSIQAQLILDTQTFLDIEVDAHHSLNTSKGVIRDHHQDLKDMTDEDIRKELSTQGVLKVNRFILKKDGKEIKTNTLFLTFDFPKPPEKIKIGYYIANVQPYIPNPLRCFQCQKFGHSKRWCKNKPACWKCGCEGHDGSECTSETTCCLNCKGDHYASSKSCPVWIQEKEIQRVKTVRCLSYGDARRIVIPPSSSSSPAAASYASAVKTVINKVTLHAECQTPAFWVGKQPSLLEASKLSPVQTTSTGLGTSEHKSSVSTNQHKTSASAPSEKPTNKKVLSNTKDSKNKTVHKKGPNDIETLNKFQSLSPPVDEEMDTTQSPRPSRSHSRSRSRSKNISPIKLK